MQAGHRQSAWALVPFATIVGLCLGIAASGRASLGEPPTARTSLSEHTRPEPPETATKARGFFCTPERRSALESSKLLVRINAKSGEFFVDPHKWGALNELGKESITVYAALCLRPEGGKSTRAVILDATSKKPLAAWTAGGEFTSQEQPAPDEP